jgi:excisionase family DNA binding protein
MDLAQHTCLLRHPFAEGEAMSAQVYTLDGLLKGPLPISRSKLYDELRSGRLRSFRIGSRRLVTEEALLNYLAALEDQETRSR